MVLYIAYTVGHLPMPRHREGEVIACWTLVNLLGSGGNAEVWRATDGGQEIALKILNQRNATSEPYQRFRQEVEALQRIGPRLDVVPLVDFNLPEVLPRGDHAWLAMPIADRLDLALSQADLREVVSSVAKIADTLADLRERHDIYHRDLKPSNLYLLDGHPALSDFGLVALPDANDLTVAGRSLGPRYFLADEMIVDAMNADPGPADVFSLAKTLWVLCSDQRWPPQGEQYASNESYSIRKYRAHPISHHLDFLVERCTRYDPSRRPSMRQVADDLLAWLKMCDSTAVPVEEAVESLHRLREVAAPIIHERDVQAEREQCFREAVRRFQEMMEPLHSQIRRDYSPARFNQSSNFVNTMIDRGWQQDVITEDVRAVILPGQGWNSVELHFGAVIRLKVCGEIEFGGAFWLGQTKTTGGHQGSWKSQLIKAPCDSLALEEGLYELSTKMQSEFPKWIEKFTAILSSSER